jgi:hypothetical protein
MKSSDMFIQFFGSLRTSVAQQAPHPRAQIGIASLLDSVRLRWNSKRCSFLGEFPLEKRYCWISLARLAGLASAPAGQQAYYLGLKKVNRA